MQREGGKPMDTVEGYLALDIRKLDCVQPLSGRTTLVTFRRGEEEVAAIRVEMLERGQIVLKYKYEQSEEIVDRIKIVYGRYHFGGNRRWFICPDCERPKVILYCRRYFRCRTCLSLAYRSQKQSALNRSLSRVAARRRKLGGSGSLVEPFPTRPKRIRLKTYSRLAAEDERECSEFLSASLAAFDKLLGSRFKVPEKGWN